MARSNYHNGTKRETCYFCGAFGNIEEHHVIPQRFDGPDTQRNTVGLCKSCHGKLELLYDKSFYEWFGIEDEKGERVFHVPCKQIDCSNRAVRVMDWDSGVAFCDPCAYEYAESHTEENTGLKSISFEDNYEERVQKRLEQETKEFGSECEPFWGGDDE